MNAIGWSMLVTAQSLVLYSRMHLVTRNRNVHRFVLGMIVASALLVQIPNWCISIPAVSRDVAVSTVWSPRDSIETRIQQVAFLLQESTISVLYIFYAHRLLKPNSHVNERRVVWDLVCLLLFGIQSIQCSEIMTILKPTRELLADAYTSRLKDFCQWLRDLS